MKVYVSLVILLGLILITIIIFKLTSKSHQGFQNFLNTAVDDNFDETGKKLINTSISNYNPISNLMNPLNNVLIPRDDSEENENLPAHEIKKKRENAIIDNEKSLQNSLNSLKVKPNKVSFDIKNKNRNAIMLNPENNGTGGIGQFIKKCEKVKMLNCDAFDDKEFDENCGMCHENGKDSKGNQIIGGLFSDYDTRTSNEEDSKNMGLRYPEYTPTVGNCNKGRFTTSKSQCIRLKNKMECEAKQNFKIPNCVLCSEKNRFVYFDDIEEKRNESNTRIVITGNVLGYIQSDQYQVEDRFTSISSPQSTTIPIIEGHEYLIQGYQLENSYNPRLARKAYISGYVEMETVTGIIQIDIKRFIIPGQIIKTGGSVEINSERYTKFINNTSVGNSNSKIESISFKIYIPYTTVTPDVDDPALTECASAPLITLERSARFLEAGSCYAKGQGPGNYSIECLQEIFIDGGCEEKGEAYPLNDFRAKKLMGKYENDRFVRNYNIWEIADLIYTTSTSAYSGLSPSGQKLNMEQWDEVSRWCTGKRILSPCTIEGDGPHSGDCLAYLWLNKGATDGVENGEGPTYVSNENNSSLRNIDAQFCTPKGTMSPIYSNGSFNQEIIDTWNNLGRTDLMWVKWLMDYFYKMSNDNTLDDEERKKWVKYCYGIDFANNMTSVQEEEITNKADVKGRKYVEYSKRGIIFSEPACPPGSIGYGGAGRCAKDTLDDAILLCNKVPSCIGITLDHGGYEPRKGELVIGTSDWARSWTIKTSTMYANTLDTRHGRTKSAFIPKRNYVEPTDIIINTVATVIGTFGIGPWYTNYGDPWGENAKIKYFKDVGNASWIWPHDKKITPVYGVKVWYPLIKRYDNDTDEFIVATVDLCVDYYTRFLFNGIIAGRADQMAAHETFEITIPPGESLFRFDVCGDMADSIHKKNGFICTVVDKSTNGVLFKTDSSWQGGVFK